MIQHISHACDIGKGSGILQLAECNVCVHWSRDGLQIIEVIVREDRVDVGMLG